MSWRLAINHATHFRYARPVVASYNEARVTPLQADGQVVVEARVTVQPEAEMYAYQDYWGALVHAFDVHDPHDSLVVTSAAVVETAAGGPSHGDRPLGVGPIATWDDLGRPAVQDRYYEFLAPSRYVVPAELAQVANQLRDGCPSPAEAVPAAIEWAHGQMEYGPGTTDVHTSAIEAWQAGRGVCQDFAHLSLAVLRAMGIPSRYVSGYFYPQAEGEEGAAVLGESHAWVEAWTGGWSARDPTNCVPVNERHVIVSRGRDYADVAPLRGIYSGPPGSSTEVTVELTRLA